MAKNIWNMLENFGVPLDISHYNALLRVYVENEHSFNPLKFLDMLEGKNIQPNRVRSLFFIACSTQNMNPLITGYIPKTSGFLLSER